MTEFVPVRIEKRDSSVVDEQELFFSLGDKDFYLPKKIRPNVAFQYLEDLNELGSDAAMARVFDTLIGPEGVEALADRDNEYDLTEDQTAYLMAHVEKRLFALMEKVSGKSSKGRRK